MSQPIVIAQLLPELNNGGVERGTIEIANFLAENNCRSIVISAGGRLVKNLSPKVLHIKLDIGKKSILVLNLIKPLRKIFLKHKVQIVHARSRLPAWLAYRAMAKLKQNRPLFITTIHGLYSVKRYSSIMARGDQVIVVSKTAEDYVNHNYKTQLKCTPQLIYRGIDAKEFPYGHQPNEAWLDVWSKEHPQLLDKKTVLLPGRLTSLKGAKELLYWLQNSSQDCRLLLTSKPDIDEYSRNLNEFFIQHQVDDKVAWIGLQNNMANIYAMADLVVSTSKRPESFGRTVLEALAIGTPVVAYNHGGVAEILEKIHPEGLVELNNVKQLSNKIQQTLKDLPVIPDTNPFSLSKMLDATLAVYQQGLKNA